MSDNWTDAERLAADLNVLRRQNATIDEVESLLKITRGRIPRFVKQYAQIGETLLASPGGPIGYWGATRICHPAANTLLGRAIARDVHDHAGATRLVAYIAMAMVVAPTILVRLARS